MTPNEMLSMIAQLRRERDEARERERVAIASWDEERQRALREGECVLEARRERDEAREALREIQAADWKTAGELRGMARKVLEAAK